MEIELDLKYLKAVELSAAKNDIRDYLMGVCIFSEKRGTFATATDGHRLAIARIGDYAGQPFDAILPLDAITAIKLLKGENKGKITFALDSAGNKHTATLEHGGQSVTVKCIDGKFPDVWRVVPQGIPANGEAANYLPAYLSDAQKAVLLIVKKGKFAWQGIYQNGRSAGVVYDQDAPELVQVIMPYSMPKGWPDSFKIPF